MVANRVVQGAAQTLDCFGMTIAGRLLLRFRQNFRNRAKRLWRLHSVAADPERMARGQCSDVSIKSDRLRNVAPKKKTNLGRRICLGRDAAALK